MRLVRSGDDSTSRLFAAGSYRRQVAGGVHQRGRIEGADTGRGSPVDRAASRNGCGSILMLTVRHVRALEILDSRGNPTLSVTVELSDGTQAAAQVPAGASTGKHEAVELRDGDPNRYRGKGVLRAVANVNDVLGPAVGGMSAEDQGGLDRRLIEVDGTRDNSRLGAKGILGVSCAVARAVAVAKRIPLWAHFAAMWEKPDWRPPAYWLVS